MKRPPFYKSVYYAFKGLFWMLKTERNFQLEVLALVINLFLMVYFQLNSTDVVLIFSLKCGSMKSQIFSMAVLMISAMRTKKQTIKIKTASVEFN
jgi:diacylglycerol kinase (ATP)